MEYARLGKSNVMVSRVALGSMNFGVRTGEAEAFRIMDRALELGINLFDTANVYGVTSGRPDGQGVTEGLIGRWLARGGERRERTVVATKVAGPMDARVYGPNDARGCSGFKIRRQLGESLVRLQTDRVDLYQLHLYDPLASKGDVLDACGQLQAQGKAFYLGTCNHAGRHLAYWDAAAEGRGVLGPVSEQHPYNLLERTAELEVIPATQELDLGLIAFRPLCAGKLSGSAHAAA